MKPKIILCLALLAAITFVPTLSGQSQNQQQPPVTRLVQEFKNSEFIWQQMVVTTQILALRGTR
jgi:hypothetical protein